MVTLISAYGTFVVGFSISAENMGYRDSCMMYYKLGEMDFPNLVSTFFKFSIDMRILIEFMTIFEACFNREVIVDTLFFLGTVGLSGGTLWIV